MWLLRFIVIFFSLVLLSCGNTLVHKADIDEKKPAWIENPGRTFPNSEYMTGIGSADTRRDAENDALAALAKIFSVEIKVNQKVLENYLETEVDGQTKSAFSSLLLGKTSASALQKLKNIRIAQTHFAQSEGVYYALAVLDRAETAAIYRSEIERNNENIKSYYKEFEARSDKLLRYKFISKTISLTQINNGLNDQLRIISGRDPGPGPYSESSLNAQKFDLVNQISFSVISNGINPEIKTYISESISKAGFKQVDTNSDFNISYKFLATKGNVKRDDIVTLQWHLEILMYDNQNHSNLQPFTRNKRSAGISEQAARAKMMRAVQKTISQDFYSEFMRYLSNL